uniref:Pro-neuregulin-3, membrane-bound isoform n=1 Tax=Oreochromis niloticus TaxID=8128 RepID=A0A669BQ63_ORENI
MSYAEGYMRSPDRKQQQQAAGINICQKKASPTVPPLRSEHFKPCHEKDLAYCLNGGECFVIETLSGPHKHCKCREGYQGIRCDQFLPKTDSILSDPNSPLAPICLLLTSSVPSFAHHASCPSIRPHPFSPAYSFLSNSSPNTKWQGLRWTEV